MYDQDMDARQVAGLLRVSTKPAYQWRRAWASGGGQRWTPAPLPTVGRGPAVDAGRLAELIRRLSCLVHAAGRVVPAARHTGLTPQVPAHHAAERDEAAIDQWRAVICHGSGKGSGRVSVAGLACLKPGAAGRFFYSLRVHRGAEGRCPGCIITREFEPDDAARPAAG
jgi:transposase